MSKKSSAILLKNFAYIGAGAAMLLSVIATVFSYDKGTNYFTTDSYLFPIAVALTIVAFALAIFSAIITPQEEIHKSSPFGSHSFVVLPAAIGFAVGTILLAVEFARTGSTLLLIAAILLLLSAVHILLCETDRRNVLLGFAPPVACAILVGVLYFDTSLEMNAPMKVIAQCALLPLMLYFTTELRYLLNREIPRLYLALALGSITVASLCALAIPVAFFAGILKNVNCLAAAAVVVGTNISIWLKLKRYLPFIPSPENDRKETDAQ